MPYTNSLLPLYRQLLTSTHTPKILVVDDVPLNAELISSIVGTLCDVITASSGQEGLLMALHHVPDLILLDVLMPDMDGFETLRQLKNEARTAHIPVIFLTSVTDSNAEELGLNMGAADFISKPFRPAILLARVRNHLELGQQRQMLERLSHSDGLTGIANRRFFNAMLTREFARMQRNKMPMSLLMIDVDDFKAYNDFYGHLQGDECLLQVSQAMAQCLKRPADLVARYGGEEFVCLLPETDMSGAVTIAQRIQATVAQLRIPHEHTQTGRFLSVSIGVAAANASEITNGQALLGIADERLYRAKRSGRNRLVHSDDAAPPTAPPPSLA